MKKVKGNLLQMAKDGHFDIVVHGCNCHADMGGGIAKQIADKYPEASIADEAFTIKDYPALQLGNMSLAPSTDGFTIVNAYTQLSPGSGSFNYAAFELVLFKIANMFPGTRIGLPYIGCGIAGADQETIVEMIEKASVLAAENDIELTLVEYDG